MLEEIELVGETVKLVPLNLTQAEALLRAGSDDVIWSYLPSKATTLAEMEAFIKDALELKGKGLDYPFAVIDKAGNRVVGTTRFLNISMPNKNLEIGWTWYTPEVWRTRVNTECKYMLLRYCFETLILNRVQLKTDVRNERSHKAILRIGAKHEGVLRKDKIMHDGYVRNANIYSIIAEERPEVKQNFEKNLLR